jgi:hypothetical protein
LLIDSSHKKWALATFALSVAALGSYAWFSHISPNGLSGGSRVGLCYGILSALLMVFAGSLSFLRKVPSWWWIGSRKLWLKGHIWLGLLSGVLGLCHSSFRWGGPLEQALWIVVALTLATGVYGLLMQQLLPHALTTRIQREAPYEQIPHICVVMRRKADALVESIWNIDILASQMSLRDSQSGIGARVQLRQFYEKQMRPFLDAAAPRQSLLRDSLQAEVAFARLRALPGLADARAQLDEMESLCEERRQLAAQERLHLWLHSWLLLHIPLSVALLVLGVAHVVSALYY